MLSPYNPVHFWRKSLYETTRVLLLPLTFVTILYNIPMISAAHSQRQPSGSTLIFDDSAQLALYELTERNGAWERLDNLLESRQKETVIVTCAQHLPRHATLLAAASIVSSLPENENCRQYHFHATFNSIENREGRHCVIVRVYSKIDRIRNGSSEKTLSAGVAWGPVHDLPQINPLPLFEMWSRARHIPTAPQ